MSEPISDFQSPKELQEHVQELLKTSDLDGLAFHYRLLSPGLLYLRVPEATRALQEYAQQEKNKLPVLARLPGPVVKHFPTHPTPWDSQLLVMPQETWDEFSEWILSLAFLSADRGLTVWTDIDVIPVSDPFAPYKLTKVNLSTIILRSNKGGWRFRAQPDGPPLATFNPKDAGVPRMRELHDKLR